MMTHFKEPVSGYVAMRMGATVEGSIKFYSELTELGTLDAATVFAMPKDIPCGNVAWIAVEDISNTLLKLIKDRTDLSLIADFEHLELDERALPRIFDHALLCHSCGNTWNAKLSRKYTKIPCAKCRSTVHVMSEGISWVGPAHEALRNLWEGLPENGDDTIELPGTLTLTKTNDGFIMYDELGHRLRVSVTADGLRASFYHHTFGPPVTVVLQSLGISIAQTAERD